MKKTLAILLALCLIVAALPIGVFTVSAATATWIRSDTNEPLAIGMTIPKGVNIINTKWDGNTVKDSSSVCQLLLNGAGGMTTNGVFKRNPTLRVDALTPKLSLTGIYTVNFDTDGGTLSNSDTYTVEGKGKFPTNLPTATKAGYDFLGWMYDGNLINASTTVSPYEYGSSVKLTASYKASGNDTGACTWSLSGTVLTISGNGAMADYPSEDAPWGTTVTKVVINEGVTAIGANAFANCKNLTEVQIPSTVTAINLTQDANSSTAAFKGCTALTAINVASGNTKYASVDGVLFNNAKNQLIYFPTGKTGSYTIPAGVIAVDNWAFNGSKLSEITIPEGVTTLGVGSFAYCDNITKVTVPKTVTSTASYVFYFDAKLTSIVIPKEFKKVGPMFAYGSPITDVYYTGSASDKASMTLGGWSNLDTNQNLEGKPAVTWHYNYTPAAAGVRVHGTAITKATVHTEDVTTVSLVEYGTTNVIKTTTVDAEGKYELTGVAAGVYELKIERPYHATRTQIIAVSSADVIWNLPIQLKGDVNNDGKVNRKDYTVFTRYSSEMITPSGYELEVMDLKADGKYSAKDLTVMKSHVTGASPLY